MIIQRGELSAVWGRIKAAAEENPDAPTILLLVAHDVDALAACAILSGLMEKEHLSFKVRSVRDYSEMGDTYVEQIADNPEWRSVILLNCAASINLMDHFQGRLNEADGADPDAPQRDAAALPHPDCNYYVIDSHRPFDIQNLHEERVHVVNDDAPNEDMEELYDQYEILVDSEWEGMSDLDDDHEPPAQRRRLTREECAPRPPARARNSAQFGRRAQFGAQFSDARLSSSLQVRAALARLARRPARRAAAAVQAVLRADVARDVVGGARVLARAAAQQERERAALARDRRPHRPDRARARRERVVHPGGPEPAERGGGAQPGVLRRAGEGGGGRGGRRRGAGARARVVGDAPRERAGAPPLPAAPLERVRRGEALAVRLLAPPPPQD